MKGFFILSHLGLNESNSLLGFSYAGNAQLLTAPGNKVLTTSF